MSKFIFSVQDFIFQVKNNWLEEEISKIYGRHLISSVCKNSYKAIRMTQFFKWAVYKILTQSMLCYAKSLQSCPTLCDPTDGNPAGSPVPAILQARTLEWVAISFSNAWKWKVKVKSLSRVRLLETPWTVAFQAPPSMGFSRQEYWSGVPLPSPINSE